MNAYEVALARSTVYRFLSLCFLYPDDSLVASFKDGVFLKEIEESLHLLTCQGKSSLCPYLLTHYSSLLPSSPSLPDLQAEHRRVFGPIIPQDCPPYETEYGKAHIFRQAHDMGDIAGFYRAFGLEVSDNARERLDHISIELEFMHFLTYKEAYALKHHGVEQAEICREAQVKFLKDHLGRWTPLFARHLAKKAHSGFYKGLAEFLRDFIALEGALLGVKPIELEEQGLKLSPFEPERDSFSCPFMDDV